MSCADSLVGARVRWRHLKDGKPVVPLAGIVRAAQLGIAGRHFMLLVEQDDCTLATVSSEDVVVGAFVGAEPTPDPAPQPAPKKPRRSLLDRSPK